MQEVYYRARGLARNWRRKNKKYVLRIKYNMRARVVRSRCFLTSEGIMFKWLRMAILLVASLSLTGCTACEGYKCISDADATARARHPGCELTGGHQIVDCRRAVNDQRCGRHDDMVIVVELSCPGPGGEQRTIQEAVLYGRTPRWELATPTPTTPP